MSTFSSAVPATSTLPARLDRLPWSGWHLRVVIALGVTWLLDGLEGSLGGSLSGVLKRPDTLGLTDAQLGLSSTLYLLGAVLGALLFGYLTDRFGRRRLFAFTLLVYLLATAGTGLSWNLASFTLFRMFTGAGIGGEYAAINSAIDELMPARVRGRIDIFINGTFWLGILVGSGLTVVLLSGSWLPPSMSWRLCFFLGALLGVVILVLRRHIPESPRWLLLRGRTSEAEQIVAAIERQIDPNIAPPDEAASPVPGVPASWSAVFHDLFGRYARRSLLGFALMVSQAFFYNAVFFTYSLVLLRYYAVPTERIGLCLLPISIANLLGPWVLGRLFDTIGRRAMIAGTYLASAVLLLVSSILFVHASLGTAGQIAIWTVMFFFASTAASSAYLTVSELFPLEIRGLSISIFYALGTLAGGVGAPALFGHFVGTGSRRPLFLGYVIGALIMALGGCAALFLGVPAERKSLEALRLTAAPPEQLTPRRS